MISMKAEKKQISPRRLKPGEAYLSPCRIDEMVYRQFQARVALSDYGREEILRALVALYLEGKIDRQIGAFVEEERKRKE